MLEDDSEMENVYFRKLLHITIMKASMSMMLLLLQLLYTNQLIVTVFEKGATYYYNEQDN